jgi:hypothetical protein
MRMKAPPTYSIDLHELKQLKPWFHEEYLQPLVQRKQAKLQLFTASELKQCREFKQCKALNLLTDQEKIFES